MRSPLLIPGVVLLAFSLLLTAWLTGQSTDGVTSFQRFGVVSWLSQAALYVGSGFVVAGELLRHLRPPAPAEDEPADGVDRWGG